MKLVSLVARYLRHLEVLNRAPGTIRHQKLDLRRFTAYLSSRGVVEAENVGKDAILGYQEELAWALTPKGELLRVTTQRTMLISVRGFLKWLYREDYLAGDLSRVVELPKETEPLPKEVIEPEEMKRLMGAVDLTSPAGWRDRAILEVLYSTGVRVNELSHVRVQDADCEQGFLYVHHGKGGRDRVVPMGRIASEFVRGYVAEARPRLLKDESTDALFLNRFGGRMSSHAVEMMVHAHARRAGLSKRITPHCFRVTCATGMLRNGAHVRYLQEILGHKYVSTLDPYLKLTATELKEMHTRFHPRERIEP